MKNKSEDFLINVNWLLLGSTDKYSLLKRRIAHICRDVTEAGCIDEICIHDIVYTFNELGYDVVKQNKND